MNNPIAVVLVAALALGAGWWMGRQGDSDLEQRIAALETRLENLPTAAPRPGSPPTPQPPAAPAELRLEGAPSRGPEDAAVTLVEFSDFECPFCLRANPTVERLRAEYPNDLRVVFKHFPLSFHKRAINAHRGVLAAGEQGKFWEMHDRVFEEPQALDAADMKRHAASLGLDVAKFEEDFAAPRQGEAIDRDVAEGRSVGVRGTPAFFINGRLLSGAQPYERFKQLVDEELAGEAG